MTGADSGTRHPAVAPGSDFYYASLYHPAPVREQLRAAAALRAELLGIPPGCSDRGVAHVKLAWWHEELSGTQAPRHDLARALRPLFEAEPAWRARYLALVERLHDALAAAAPADEPALRAWTDNLHGDFAGPLARLARPGLAVDDSVLRELAVDTELLRGVLELRSERRAGPAPFARTTLAGHGLSVASVVEATHTAALGALVEAELGARRSRLAASVAALPRRQRRAARLPVTLARLALRAAALTLADGAAVLERRVEPTPVAKLVIAWRTCYLG